MHRNISLLLLLCACCMYSCRTNESAAPPLSKEQVLQKNLTELKATAQPGDLLLRLTDDIISQQVTRMNERDLSFSHCGLVMEKNGKKYVYHIAPNVSGADTIETLPIDTFINPEKNIKCALYRYQLSAAETDSLMGAVATFKKQDVRFDPVYNLASNDSMYCSEMVAKALRKATNGRIVCKELNPPERMLPMLMMYFKKYHPDRQLIANRKFITLDNLYLRPDCRELMHFDLKIFPGQE